MSAFRLAVLNLFHDRGRTTVSVLGAAFAVVLIFMQLGFLGSVETTATLLYDRLNFDVIIVSKEYLDLSRPGTVERVRLAQARSIPGVAEVAPISVGQALWRNPTADPARGGKRWPITVLGVDPGRLNQTFGPTPTGLFASTATFDAAKMKLGQIDVVYLDELSRPDFGDRNDSAMQPGITTTVNGRKIELAGYFQLGTGFSYTGLLLVNEETFSNLTLEPQHRVTFGLVSVTDPSKAAETARAIEAAIPSNDIRAFTRQELGDHERSFWVDKTAVGKFFYFGVVLALLVGAIFVYQMMVADIKKRLPEYATLMAVGYKFGYLFRVVVWQSVLLAGGGYAGGLVAAFGLYAFTRWAAQMPIAMTPGRAGFVFALTIGMCVGSGLLAVRKVKSADPADLF